MIYLEDGPAAGQTFAAERAPVFLRATHLPGRAKHDGWDVLNDRDDTPEPDERIYVYRAVQRRPPTFACGRGTAGCMTVANVTYRHVPDVDGESVRGTDAWRTWATSQPGGPAAADGAGADQMAAG